jgi:hypothetical protein
LLPDRFGTVYAVNEPPGWVIFMVVGFSSSQGYRFELIDPRASSLQNIEPFFQYDTESIIANIDSDELVMLGLATKVRSMAGRSG